MIVKRGLRLFLPASVRYFLAGCLPRIYSITTLVLENPQFVSSMIRLPENFLIRMVSDADMEMLKEFHRHKGINAFKHNTIPRLRANEFSGLAAFNTFSYEIAYLSWIINKSIPYFEEFGIYLQHGDFLVKDIFVVPKYRNIGLSSRMEQERINYCVGSGLCKRIFVQILKSNEKGLRVYEGLGYKVVQEDYIVRWYIFNVYRSLKGFMRRPFRKVVK